LFFCVLFFLVLHLDTFALRTLDERLCTFALRTLDERLDTF